MVAMALPLPSLCTSMRSPVPVAPSQLPSEALKWTVAPAVAPPPSVGVAVTVSVVLPSPGRGLGVATTVMAGVVEQAPQRRAAKAHRAG